MHAFVFAKARKAMSRHLIAARESSQLTTRRRLHDGYKAVTRRLDNSYTMYVRRVHDGNTVSTQSTNIFSFHVFSSQLTIGRRLHDGYKAVTRRLDNSYTMFVRRVHDGNTSSTQSTNNFPFTFFSLQPPSPHLPLGATAPVNKLLHAIYAPQHISHPNSLHGNPC